MVAVVGEVTEGFLAEVARSSNVSLVRQPDAADGQAPQPGLDAAIEAFRRAGGRGSPFVLVVADPLAEVAEQWRVMWDLSAPETGAMPFEAKAADALAAYRAGRFELPDYYLELTGGDAPSADMYLGPLRSARPNRVAVVPGDGSDAPEQAARVLEELRSLRQGPWWPPLEEIIDTARRFFAGGLSGDSSLAARD